MRAIFQAAVDSDKFSEAYDQAYGLSHSSNAIKKEAGLQMFADIKRGLKDFVNNNKNKRKDDCISILRSAIDNGYAYEGAEQDLEELMRPIEIKPKQSATESKPSSISIIDPNGQSLSSNDVLQPGQNYQIKVNNAKEGYKLIIKRGSNTWDNLSEIKAQNGTYVITYTGPEGHLDCSLTIKCKYQ